MARISRIRRLHHGDPIPDGEPRRYLGANGYIRLRWRVAPYELVEVYEHRFVMGMPPEELDVHHLDHDKTNNDPSNLVIVTTAAHGEEHAVHDRDEMVRLYESGLSTPQVGAVMGCDAAVVYRGLVARGVSPRSIGEALYHPTVEQNRDRIIDALMRGVRARAIAEVLGCSPEPIERIGREEGIPASRPGRPTNQERQHQARALARLFGVLA